MPRFKVGDWVVVSDRGKDFILTKPGTVGVVAAVDNGVASRHLIDFSRDAGYLARYAKAPIWDGLFNEHHWPISETCLEPVEAPALEPYHPGRRRLVTE